MTQVTLNNGKVCETGCVVDGHWGIYCIDHMMDQCAGLVDFDTDEYIRVDSTLYRNADPAGLLVCTYDDIRFTMADELESALNAATPEGFLWHWSDGEFFLSPICDGLNPAECADDTCACHCD